MPEMKGRSLEELDELFLNRVSVRNFRKYECALRQDAANDVQMKKADDLEVKNVTTTHAEEAHGNENESGAENKETSRFWTTTA